MSPCDGELLFCLRVRCCIPSIANLLRVARVSWPFVQRLTFGLWTLHIRTPQLVDKRPGNCGDTLSHILEVSWARYTCERYPGRHGEVTTGETPSSVCLLWCSAQWVKAQVQMDSGETSTSLAQGFICHFVTRANSKLPLSFRFHLPSFLLFFSVSVIHTHTHTHTHTRTHTHHQVSPSQRLCWNCHISPNTFS